MKNRGRYRIQAVSRMTGVPAPTLRAWERRYGIPSPERTDASYRLYRDTDIDLIRRLKAHIDEGMAPSEAAALVKRLAEAEAIAQPTPTPNTDAYAEAVERIIGAVHRFDPPALETAVRQAMLLGSARTIFDKVFAPTLTRIGDAWHAGRLSIAQEHLASEHLGNATRDLLRLLQPDAPLRRVVLACVADEFHIVPLYGSALHFVQWGYAVVMLGVNTPPEALAHAVASLEPDAVGLSTTQAIKPAAAKTLMAAYAQACGPVPWVVGGSNVEALTQAVTDAGGLVATGAPDTIRDALDARIKANKARR